MTPCPGPTMSLLAFLISSLSEGYLKRRTLDCWLVHSMTEASWRLKKLLIAIFFVVLFVTVLDVFEFSIHADDMDSQVPAGESVIEPYRTVFQVPVIQPGGEDNGGGTGIQALYIADRTGGSGGKGDEYIIAVIVQHFGFIVDPARGKITIGQHPIVGFWIDKDGR